jgi:hypothetical protein
MDPPRSRGPVLASVLFLVGGALLLSTLALGWYTTWIANGTKDSLETLFLTHVQVASDQTGTNYNGAASFAAVWLPNTGTLYLIVAGIVILAAIFAFVVATLILARDARRRKRLTPILMVAAIALAAAGPVLLFAVQPALECADSSHLPPPPPPSEYGNSTSSSSCGWGMPAGYDSSTPYAVYESSSAGPQSSFFGSQPFHLTSSDTGYSLDWGPSYGWYVALIATLLIGMGALRYRAASRSAMRTPAAAEADPIDA